MRETEADVIVLQTGSLSPGRLRTFLDRDQLEDAGIATLRALARSAGVTVPRIGAPTLERLRLQAYLQLEQYAEGDRSGLLS